VWRCLKLYGLQRWRMTRHWLPVSLVSDWK
jgi:hypothetical protein